ncbi:hypothetical protein ACQPZJ_09550 [Actinoplanes sp. CA-054009]
MLRPALARVLRPAVACVLGAAVACVLGAALARVLRPAVACVLRAALTGVLRAALTGVLRAAVGGVLWGAGLLRGVPSGHARLGARPAGGAGVRRGLLWVLGVVRHGAVGVPRRGLIFRA